MADYIERNAVIEAFENSDTDVVDWEGHGFSLPNIRSILQSVPVVDVAPVVYGEWIQPRWKNSDYCCNCSKCGGEAMHREYQWNKKGIYPICPNCGAIMVLKGK